MFSKHCENLREIEKAIKLIERNINNSIRRNNELGERVYTKILSFLVVSWLDVRILKLIYEKVDYNNKYSQNIFDDNEIRIVIKNKSLIDRWKVSLNFAMKKAYSVKLDKKNISIQETKLNKTAIIRYKEIIKILDNDINPAITLRNKVAHGQFLHAFNNDLESFSQDNTTQLRLENIVTLQLKRQLFTNIAKLIHDLVVSKPTYERDFDKHFEKIESIRSNIHKRDYNKHRNNLPKISRHSY